MSELFGWDTDRIHNVIDNDPREQGVGKTTAILAQLMGEVQLGDPHNSYLYVGENANWATAVSERFKLYE